MINSTHSIIHQKHHITNNSRLSHTLLIQFRDSISIGETFHGSLIHSKSVLQQQCSLHLLVLLGNDLYFSSDICRFASVARVAVSNRNLDTHSQPALNASFATIVRIGICLNNVQPGRVPLEQHDPELFDLIEKEKNRSWKSLEMIASEV